MKYFFIVNPLAGKFSPEAKIRETLSKLPQKKDCEIYITKSSGDATVFVQETCKKYSQEEIRFIACGGDGTINEVFSGAMGFSNVSVSCFPSGSGNDFVKVFGTHNFQDIEKLLTAPTQKLDILKIGDRYSVNVTNFGFDTTVVKCLDAHRARTGHGSKFAYTKGIMKALIFSMKSKCKVFCDDKLINPNGQALLCTIANGQYVGGSFRCAPRSKTNDGLMEVCLIKPISHLRFFQILPQYISGTFLEQKKFQDIVVYQQAKKVEVSGPDGFEYTLDGEIIRNNNFTVEIIHNALNFACPKQISQ